MIQVVWETATWQGVSWENWVPPGLKKKLQTWPLPETWNENTYRGWSDYPASLLVQAWFPGNGGILYKVGVL